MTYKDSKPNLTERIWHTITLIPQGKVASYGKIADLAGVPGRARYVGYCLRNTPEGLILPWYRVVKSNGQLAFSSGSEMAKKQTSLLCDEGVTMTSSGRVNMNDNAWNPDLDTLLHGLTF